MGNCIDIVSDEDECRAIVRSNPWVQRLPFIRSQLELQAPLEALAAMPGEFCWSRDLSPGFVAELCFRGFLPMAELTQGGQVRVAPSLTPWPLATPSRLPAVCAAAEAAHAALRAGVRETACRTEGAPTHRAPPPPARPRLARALTQICTPSSHASMLSQEMPPPDLTRGQVVKRAKGFFLTVNTCFDEVVRGCQRQHGKGCWLHAPLVAAFRALHEPATPKPANPKPVNPKPAASAAARCAAATAKKGAVGGEACGMQGAACQPLGHTDGLGGGHGGGHGVRVHSFELWRETAAGSELVAGELGYSMGGCYTSLSGFFSVASAGTVQCIATACVLKRRGAAPSPPPPPLHRPSHAPRAPHPTASTRPPRRFPPLSQRRLLLLGPLTLTPTLTPSLPVTS